MGNREKMISNLIALAKDSCDGYLLDVISSVDDIMDEIVDDLSKTCKIFIIAGDRDSLKKTLEDAKTPAKELDEYYAAVINKMSYTFG